MRHDPLQHRLSPTQRAVLARARDGEDRMLPEVLDPGPPPIVVPPRRWFVPAGLVVPSGGPEYQACRLLAARGLLKAGTVAPSPELPYGQGGYLITKKGRAVIGDEPAPAGRRVLWRRSTGDYVESRCGHWWITPIYGGLTRPERFELRLDHKVVGSGSSQRECKVDAERVAEERGI